MSLPLSPNVLVHHEPGGTAAQLLSVPGPWIVMSMFPWLLFTMLMSPAQRQVRAGHGGFFCSSRQQPGLPSASSQNTSTWRCAAPFAFWMRAHDVHAALHDPAPPSSVPEIALATLISGIVQQAELAYLFLCLTARRNSCRAKSSFRLPSCFSNARGNSWRVSSNTTFMGGSSLEPGRLVATYLTSAVFL